MNNEYPGSVPVNCDGQPVYASQTVKKSAPVYKVLAVTGFILGLVCLILSIAYCWYPTRALIFAGVCMVGIILSAIGIKSRASIAIAGLIVSINGTVFGLLFMVIFSIFTGTL